jgi:hypothetical protein
MKRRTVLAGAAWAVPTILVAKPSGAATLSLAPGEFTPQGVPATETPKPTGPLAFTGDDIERDAGIGAALVAAGWLLTRWQAQEMRS